MITHQIFKLVVCDGAAIKYFVLYHLKHALIQRMITICAFKYYGVHVVANHTSIQNFVLHVAHESLYDKLA